ncbi:hypothetical protein HY546_02805 [archaeon]|nr:hypothetical protein [archaeon]
MALSGASSCYLAEYTSQYTSFGALRLILHEQQPFIRWLGVSRPRLGTEFDAADLACGINEHYSHLYEAQRIDGHVLKARDGARYLILARCSVAEPRTDGKETKIPAADIDYLACLDGLSGRVRLEAKNSREMRAHRSLLSFLDFKKNE